MTLEKRRNASPPSVRKEWHDPARDWSDRNTVPENPSRASAVIVVVGTVFAAATMGATCLYEIAKDHPGSLPGFLQNFLMKD